MAYTFSIGVIIRSSFSIGTSIAVATFFLSWYRLVPEISITPANRALRERILVYSGLSRKCSSPADSITRLTISGKTAS